MAPMAYHMRDIICHLHPADYLSGSRVLAKPGKFNEATLKS